MPLSAKARPQETESPYIPSEAEIDKLIICADKMLSEEIKEGQLGPIFYLPFQYPAEAVLGGLKSKGWFAEKIREGKYLMKLMKKAS